jgi:dihydroorotase
MHVHLREPGDEYKEDIASGGEAALAGGFTSVCCMPNTDPPNDNRAVTEYILRRAAEADRVRVFPVGAITKGRKGERLAEMAEMAEAGIVAVSDDGDCVAHAGLMRRALEYARTFNLPVIQHCEDLNLSHRAPMHEAVNSCRAGLGSQPAAAESVMVGRDIILCRMTGARYHVAHVSTAESVELIRSAKAEGISITAEAAIHHLHFTDEHCLTYDTNTKVNPPLRAREDMAALRAALKDGTIDALVSDHAPHAPTEKELEYDYAAFGMVGLETALPLGLKLADQNIVGLKDLVRLWTTGPAGILGLDLGSLKPDMPGDVTVVDPTMNWKVTIESLRSKSHNTPLLGMRVKGRAVLTAVGGRVLHEITESGE